MLIHGENTPINKETYSFLIHNYGDQARVWLDSINDVISKLCQKWNIVITDYEEHSRFGCILYGVGNDTEVVLKLVPPCCHRLQDEINCYFELPYSSMVKLYAYDLELGGFLLKRIRDIPILKLDGIAKLFHTMYGERQLIKSTEITPYKVPFYESLKNAWDTICNRSDAVLKDFLPYIARAKKAFSMVENNPCYLLHGDAHIHNILDDGQNIFLIDPIGYAGPFEIEYARFIGTYIRENDLYHASLKDLVSLVCGDYSPIEDIYLALGYDVTMRACNAFIEGDTESQILDAILWAEKIWKLIDQTQRDN